VKFEAQDGDEDLGRHTSPVSRSTITSSSPTGLRLSDRKHKLPPGPFAARTYSERARGPLNAVAFQG
jgi:hypothetical protein